MKLSGEIAGEELVVTHNARYEHWFVGRQKCNLDDVADVELGITGFDDLKTAAA